MNAPYMMTDKETLYASIANLFNSLYMATVDLDEKMLFITMLLVNSYCLGTRRQQWMPFRPPFSTTGEQLVKNASSRQLN
jgi:hypothetical protein